MTCEERDLGTLVELFKSQRMSTTVYVRSREILQSFYLRSVKLQSHRCLHVVNYLALS